MADRTRNETPLRDIFEEFYRTSSDERRALVDSFRDHFKEAVMSDSDPQNMRQIRTGLAQAPVVDGLAWCEDENGVVTWDETRGHHVTDTSTPNWFPCEAVHRPLRIDLWSTRRLEASDD